jgi:phage tail sheath protein FI
MPGITITTTVRNGPVEPTTSNSSQAFFVGKAERGPINRALLVKGMGDFELKYGPYVSGYYLHSTVQSFFEEGGTQCYVARVEKTTSGTASVAATATIPNDVATPSTAITLTADGPGTWANGGAGVGLQWTIAVGSVTGSRILNVYLNGALLVSTGSCTTTAQMVGKINTHPAAANILVATETNAGVYTSETTMPDINETLQSFAGGTIGATAIADSQYTTALGFFNDSLGTGIVAIPEVASTVASATVDAVSLAIIAHCNSYSRIAALHGAYDDTTAEIRDLANNVTSGTNAEHVAIYYPWVSVPTGTTGVSRFIPPSGYVAGARARAHTQVGPHQPGAGIISDARFVNGVYASIDRTNGDLLDAESVNAIRIINNRVRIYGARSCSSDTSNFRFITAQDVVNYVVVRAFEDLEDVLFSPIDGRGTMFAEIEGRLIGILEPLRGMGALYEAFDVNGVPIDKGYTVTCNNSVNPLAQLIDGTVTARVGLRVSGVGDKIQVDIIKSNLTASVV